jgi:hypothetical protein
VEITYVREVGFLLPQTTRTLFYTYFREKKYFKTLAPGFENQRQARIEPDRVDSVLVLLRRRRGQRAPVRHAVHLAAG